VVDIGWIIPNRDLDFYMNKNPLYCGTVVMAQRLSAEEAGVRLANHHGLIFAVAYIYNALRKMGLTDIVWPDMERIITLHTKYLFAGDVPSTPEEMRARVMFQLGVDRNVEKTRFDLKTLEKRYMPISKTSTLLLEHFRTKTPPLDYVVHQLQGHVEQRQSTSTTSNTEKRTGKRILCIRSAKANPLVN
jgi:hypothetical protein